MSFLSKIVKAGIDTIALPIAIVKDIATMGGAIIEKHEPFTISKLKEIGKDVEEIKDEL